MMMLRSDRRGGIRTERYCGLILQPGIAALAQTGTGCLHFRSVATGQFLYDGAATARNRRLSILATAPRCAPTRRSPNPRSHRGNGIYRYRYLRSDAVYVGVMAQEVAALAAEAVNVPSGPASVGPRVP
jgi:hypothetical protein